MTESEVNSRAAIGGNNPPPDPAPDPFDVIKGEIEGLFEEASNFCDGEPIASPEMAAAITKIYDSLHDAGKRADAMRAEEKKPHDLAAKAVQAKYNPLVQDKKGKVALGKAACGQLLAPWRARLQREAAAEAERIAKEAREAEAAAQAAIRASRGDLSARVVAEEQVSHAKGVAKAAKRAEKASTTKTGLRSVWVAELADPGAALDWAYARDAWRFEDLVQSMANEAVRLGAREVPGFPVRETKVV